MGSIRIVRTNNAMQAYILVSSTPGHTLWVEIAPALGLVGDFDLQFNNTVGEHWFIGDPEECGWYLAAYDIQEGKLVTQLWFNPQSREKWWEGSPGQTEPFRHADKVTHYMRLPDPPEGGW